VDDVLFRDRADAGRRLAQPLRLLLEGRVTGGDRPGGQRSGDSLPTPRPPQSDTPVVLGMARGGVPVAAAVADALGTPLDVIVVRKLGHPAQPELGMGAIGEGGVRLVNATLVDRLGVSPTTVDAVAHEQALVLGQRLRRYRSGRLPVPLEGRVAIVVDDGLATGFTAHAALEVVRRRGARWVVLAVPVGPPAAVDALRSVADEVVCLVVSDAFMGISQWYVDFGQVPDGEVARLLAEAAKRQEVHATRGLPPGSST
jgi:putative phosphoribosyl transferase